MPAPPTVNYAYGLDPNVTADGQHPTAYTYGDTVHLPDHAKSMTNSFIKAHETGHVFDTEVLSDGDRYFLSRLIHAPPGPWQQQSVYKSPNEWFADYYAAAASGVSPTNGDSVSMYATIGPKRLKRFEAALGRIAKRQHLSQSYSG